jgi:selenocysteine lyase/cysteine desulfurase
MSVASRRSFLRGLSAAAGTFPAFAQQLRQTPPAGKWDLVWKQFPLADGLMYLNAANVAPCSQPALDLYRKQLQDFQSDPSFQNRAKYAPAEEAVRSKLAALVRAKPDEIAMTRNTSEASNIIVQGIDLKPGDEIVVTSHNHPSNLDSWKIRARRHGLVVRVIPEPRSLTEPAQLVDLCRKKLSPRTKVIAITHLTSTIGVLYPAREIAELARSRGIWMHLDGAQTLGAMEIDLKRIGCDSYSSSAHKWPMGPLECGVLYIREERLPQIWPSIVTAGWRDNLVGARKFEVFGQRDDPRLVAFGAAIDFLNELGVPAIEERVRFLATRLRNGLLETPGITVHGSREAELCFSVVKAKHARVPSRKLYDELWARHRMALSLTPEGEIEGVRFSPHIYNSVDEIDAAVSAVRRACA